MVVWAHFDKGTITYWWILRNSYKVTHLFKAFLNKLRKIVLQMTYAVQLSVWEYCCLPHLNTGAIFCISYRGNSTVIDTHIIDNKNRTTQKSNLHSYSGLLSCKKKGKKGLISSTYDLFLLLIFLYWTVSTKWMDGWTQHMN